MTQTTNTKLFDVQDYDLTATLTSGQAFRWEWRDASWIGVIGHHWVRLRGDEFSITAQTAEPVEDWAWLSEYLQLQVNLGQVLLTFPNDPPLQAARVACHGLRLLRQELWECLASFILSSTKQIVQIQQIIAALCQRFGEPLKASAPYGPAYAFPSPARLARATEAELRACKMGFRAPYLLETARIIAAGEYPLNTLPTLTLDLARGQLMQLPGVGRKIADCVLLFGCGFQEAFPVDVWVLKALRQLYFPRRKVSLARLHEFAATHFGPHAGYAQQYLFHYMRKHSDIGRGSRAATRKRGSPRKAA